MVTLDTNFFVNHMQDLFKSVNFASKIWNLLNAFWVLNHAELFTKNNLYFVKLITKKKGFCLSRYVYRVSQ